MMLDAIRIDGGTQPLGKPRDTYHLLLRPAPARVNRLLLSAEPSFSISWVYDCSVVELTTRHMIDLLAFIE